ncbi:FAD-binding oxidoreductase [Georgfuchsia toluolica]|uniref:FAD-binding oxidoreductase n=1 Tax=Georgfuchsia toluolica TaxID=424218 RepID=A0A916NGL5_9PROT|nr:FAD-binding oxidoreductase [Georgfuchsia toluolica]CAG4882337.1 FAD-binding oxidoreductase [Georgfuchsia toluolica]
MSDLIAALRGAIGATQVLTSADDMAAYLTDWRGRYQGDALCVVRPGTTEEVAQVVHLCNEAKVAMVPQGGNTGLCGGATPCGGEVLISLARLNRVRAVDTDNNTITVEAGCTLHAVQEAAHAAGRLFPLSIASEGSATIGGCLSTNAGGVQVLRYGNARELSLGIEAVLPDGRVWNGLRGLRKDNTGYDLKHLFIGAEGTLGLITAAVLKLFPLPRRRATAWVAVASPAAAVSLLTQLRSDCGDAVTAFELISATALELVMRHIPGSRQPLAAPAAWQVLLELSEFAANNPDVELENSLAKATGVQDAILAQNESQRLALWRLRENISEAQKIEGFSIKHDIAVPVSRIAEFVAAADAAIEKHFPGVRVVCFGHVGDGNLHYNLSMLLGVENAGLIARSHEANLVVHDIVHSLGGSISAEHGLGQLKRDEIKRYKSETEMELMQSIKHVLDSHGLMNPGKML